MTGRAIDSHAANALTPGEAIALLDLIDNEQADREWNRYELASARKKLDAIREAHALEVIDDMIAHLEAL